MAGALSLFGFVCFLALPTTLSAANQYVGSEVCRSCHPNITTPFFRNPHFKSIASGKEKPENTGCESCHGPGGDHVAADGGKSTIFAFSQATPAKVLDTCLRCHNQAISRANIRRSEQHRAAASSSAPIAIPFIVLLRPSFSSLRRRRISATDATLLCELSFPCLSSTA